MVLLRQEPNNAQRRIWLIRMMAMRKIMVTLSRLHHWTGYWSFGLDVWFEVAVIIGPRDFLDRVLKNYGGSVYLIQGMHDWNVDPHMAIPTINKLYDNGIEAKGCLDNGTTIIRTGQFSYWKDQTWVAEVGKHSFNDSIRLDAGFT